MPTSDGSNSLPDWAMQWLDGTGLRQSVGRTVMLTTTDESGWPHIALLSMGEVLAMSPNEIRLALWPKSTTTANLKRTGQGTLAMFRAGEALYARIQVEHTNPLNSLRFFCTRVVHVRRDAVGYAQITSGIRFRLVNPSSTISRWRATIDRLRAVSCRGGA